MFNHLLTSEKLRENCLTVIHCILDLYHIKRLAADIFRIIRIYDNVNL